jgi:hypothetical protein
VAILTNITLARRARTKLAAHVADNARSVGRGDNVLSSCSSARVDSLVAVIVASVRVLIPIIIAICARGACVVILV